MSEFLFVICFIIIVLLSINFVSISNKYNKLKYMYEYEWPVKHRLDHNGFLQYSVNGVLWTHIVGYNECFDFGDHKGPFLEYLKFEGEDDDNYKAFCNTLSTMQKCHEWNRNALDLYINEINKQLKS